ncbi:MAG: outer membrane lipoprotein-sorting protein [Acidobacteriota bacterium]|jgi:outer membrane lipoprotein-sorting protein|nr:outer membrane lipoprotein-sorting protein [Acidobacteriota bacterium]
MMFFRTGNTLPLILLTLCAMIAAGEDPRAREIVQRMDELYRADSSEALMEMVITTPHWERALKIRSWSRGTNKTFLRILEPRKEKGMATLRVGNEMWNYLPKTDKVMKIPPSMMMGSWMGSDFTNDDLVKEYTFLEDYEFAMAAVDAPVPGLLYVKSIPKPDRPIVWGHVITAVREEGLIPVWQEFFDEKGNRMRRIEFSEVRVFSDRTIPSVMTLEPLNKKGHRTVVRYLEAAFNIAVSEDIFSLRNLRTRE